MSETVVSVEESRQRAQRYLDNPGLCPFCGSTSCDGEGYDADGESIAQAISCAECGEEWTDLYVLHAVSFDDDHGYHKAASGKEQA